ncbi:hypothetical protein AAEX37_00990 [Oligella sp. MSHR50489EDL]|uniref:hypothetical protein n=1 Tax=Oligella sp. MSHR50489EDL TaxID=3139409 RepID=UPI003D81B303
MNKPTWNTAPDWANYLARDKSGEWNWFECEPSIDESTDSWLNNKGIFVTANFQHETSPDDAKWFDTLESRADAKDLDQPYFYLAKVGDIVFDHQHMIAGHVKSVSKFFKNLVVSFYDQDVVYDLNGKRDDGTGDLKYLLKTVVRKEVEDENMEFLENHDLNEKFNATAKYKAVKNYAELIKNLLLGQSFYYTPIAYYDCRTYIFSLDSVIDNDILHSLKRGRYVYYFDPKKEKENIVKDPLLLAYAVMVKNHSVLALDAKFNIPIEVINKDYFNKYGKDFVITDDINYYILEEQE